MNKSLSSYLNVIRFVAALLVYLYHAGHFSGIKIPVLSHLGQEAVVVFFVLSGFVIAYSCQAKATTAEGFALDRLARLWSVMIPAFALTVVADLIGQSLALPVYGALQPYDAFKWVASIGINAAFLSQVWSLNIWPGSNGPFWSISFEFWFYLIFGVAMFSRGVKRLVLIGLAVGIAGPTIMSAFPVWALGVLLFRRLSISTAEPVKWAWPLWIGTWVAACLALLLEIGPALRSEFPATAEHSRWGVNFWPVSYALGLLVALNIYTFSGIHTFGNFLAKHSRTIRVVADSSFGLYLFHYPLLYVTKAALVSDGVDGLALGLSVLIIPFVVSVALAHQCERFKPVLRDFLQRVWMRVTGRSLDAIPPGTSGA